MNIHMGVQRASITLSVIRVLTFLNKNTFISNIFVNINSSENKYVSRLRPIEPIRVG